MFQWDPARPVQPIQVDNTNPCCPANHHQTTSPIPTCLLSPTSTQALQATTLTYQTPAPRRRRQGKLVPRSRLRLLFRGSPRRGRRRTEAPPPPTTTGTPRTTSTPRTTGTPLTTRARRTKAAIRADRTPRRRTTAVLRVVVMARPARIMAVLCPNLHPQHRGKPPESGAAVVLCSK